MNLEQKQAMVEELINKNHLPIKVGPIHSAALDKHYRNKVIVAFAKHKGRVYAGQYAPHSHRVIKDGGKSLQPKIINDIIDTITELVQSMKIYLYNEQTGTGVLRHVLIRWGHATNEVMVVFVTGTNMFPSRKNMVHALRNKHPEIKTILQEVNGRKTSVVMENKPMVLYGKGTIDDILCGKRITIPATAFYQIHSQQCEVLYGLAKEKLQLTGKETILDTYCGLGTIGLSLADACKSVMGVEINKEAIHYAKINARQNHIKNMQFVDMDATAFMMEAKRYHHPYDVIVLDPPRAGTTQQFIYASTSLAPKKILYISCDPRTLVRDLKQFRRAGYVTDRLDLVDMFPRTEHVESVVLLGRSIVANNEIEYMHVDYEPEDAEYLKGIKGSATYAEIKAWIKKQYNVSVSSLYIAQCKSMCGFEKRENYNTGAEGHKVPNCPAEKRELIMKAFKHFKMI